MWKWKWKGLWSLKTTHFYMLWYSRLLSNIIACHVANGRWSKLHNFNKLINTPWLYHSFPTIEHFCRGNTILDTPFFVQYTPGNEYSLAYDCHPLYTPRRTPLVLIFNMLRRDRTSVIKPPGYATFGMQHTIWQFYKHMQTITGRLESGINRGASQHGTIMIKI